MILVMNFFHDTVQNINNLNNINTIVANNLNTISYSINNISILSLNIRSIRAHFDELIASLDILFLSETWLCVNQNFSLNGYNYFSSLGILNKADGVCMFVSDFYTVVNVNIMVIPNCNSIKVTLSVGDDNIIVVGLYRSPSERGIFLSGLDSYLNDMNDKTKIIYCGDTNIDIL